MDEVMTNAKSSTDDARAPSQFVTVLAWFSIVASALMLLVSAMQNIMLHVFFPPNALSLVSEADARMLPPFAMFMFSHFKAIVFAFFVLSVILLASSIGLLKRKNWARLVFVSLLVVGIAWTVGSLFLQQSMLVSMPRVEGPEGKHIEDFMWIFRGIMIVFAAVFTAIHGWLIYKLCSPSIRAEFC
jgi:hypothetical protein